MASDSAWFTRVSFENDVISFTNLVPSILINSTAALKSV